MTLLPSAYHTSAVDGFTGRATKTMRLRILINILAWIKVGVSASNLVNKVLVLETALDRFVYFDTLDDMMHKVITELNKEAFFCWDQVNPPILTRISWLISALFLSVSSNHIERGQQHGIHALYFPNIRKIWPNWRQAIIFINYDLTEAHMRQTA